MRTDAQFPFDTMRDLTETIAGANCSYRICNSGVSASTNDAVKACAHA